MISVKVWLNEHLISGVWDNLEHAVTNLVTCGFTREAAEEAVKSREKAMLFREKLYEFKDFDDGN
jgi:hypothetical protein